MSKSDLNLLRQSKDTYGTEFENHLFDQYKLYVEMADRISARRMLANSFFVGVHTDSNNRLYRAAQRKCAETNFAYLCAFCRLNAFLLRMGARCEFVPAAKFG